MRTNEENKRKFPVNLEHGKLPPQALDLEEGVLGGILLESKSFYLVSPILSHVSFYKEEHQKIFKAIESLDRKRIKIDLLTVPEELRIMDYLDEVGGIAYIAQLSARVASAAHIEDHAKIVQQKFIQREVIRISSETLSHAFDESIDVMNLIEFMQVGINGLIRQNVVKPGRTIGEIGGERIKELQELSKNEVKFSGIPSGFTRIDRHTGGWQNSDLILIAARPSMGKSFFGLKFAINACKFDKKAVVFSLEMSDKQLYDRELSSITGIENTMIRKADFTNEEWEKIEKAQGILESYNLIVDDTPALTVAQFKAKSLMYTMDHGVDIIIVDYLQLMKSPAYKEHRNLEVGDISSNLKAVAKELNIPVIALCQISRRSEDRSSKKPLLSDLRESGNLEQDADVVGFIHRPEYYGIKESDDHTNSKNLIEFILAKHRNGDTGTIKLWKTNNWTEITDSQFNDNDITPIDEKPDDLPF